MKPQNLITLLIVPLCLFFSSCNIKIIDGLVKNSKKQLELKDKTFTTSDGYTIAYSDNELSNKPTLFFVHGYLVSRYNFFPLAKKFKKGDYHIIAVDVPGFGESSKDPNGSYKITQQAKRLNELMDHLKLKEVHLVGTSMGGAISIAMNGMNPSILSSTLIAPFGMPLYTQELPGILDHFVETGQAAFIVENPYNEKRTKALFHYVSNTPSFIMPGFLRKEVKEILVSGREATNKVGKDMLYEMSSMIDVIRENPKYNKIAKELNIDPNNMDVSSPEKVAALLNKVNKSHNVQKIDQIGTSYENLTPYLEKINNPVLVIWGTKDNIIHYKTMEKMKPCLKDGKYKLLTNGTHSVSLLRAHKISKEMKKFFQEKKLP